jgi:hypothetical protein
MVTKIPGIGYSWVPVRDWIQSENLKKFYPLAFSSRLRHTGRQMKSYSGHAKHIISYLRAILETFEGCGKAIHL